MGFDDSVRLSYEQAITETAAQLAPLGMRGTTPDGRVFRYAKNGAVALKVGMGITPAAQGVLTAVNTSAGLNQLPAGTTVGTTWNRLVIGGSMYATTYAANTFAEGYLLVGSTQYYSAQMLKLKSHGNIKETTSGSMVDAPTTFVLEDGVFPVEAINTSQAFGLIPNPYSGVLVMVTNAAQALPIIGITPIAVTASYYFWALTHGPGIVRVAEQCTSATVLGRPLMPSPDAATTGFMVVTSSSLAVAVGAFQTFATLLTGGPAGGYAVANINIAA